MISFNTIPVSLLPGQFIEFDMSRAVSGLPLIPHRALIVAPHLATGTLAALTPSRVRSAAEGEAFHGRGSVGAAMIKAFKDANPYTDLWTIGVADNGAGVAATGTLTVTGPATASGTLQTYIAGTRVSTTITNGDAQNLIATNLAAAINADTSLPVTAAAATNVVTLTARNKGTQGNDIDVRLNYNYGDVTPAGVAVAIVAMASGATNPDFTTVTAALGDSWYNTIVMPWTGAAELTVLEAWALARWGGTSMKEVQAFAGYYGTYGNASTLASGRNSPFISIMSTQKSPTPTWVFASVVAALDASQCESPANVNRPRQTMSMPGCLPPKETDRYTDTERHTLLPLGGATFTVDSGGNCRIERLVTTYKTSNGVPDPSMRDVEDMRNYGYLRFSTRARIALKYPRHKLANDGTPIAPGQPIVTPKVIRDELITLFIDWQDAGLVEGLDQFKRDLLVERNASDVNQVDAIIPPDVINGFRRFAAQIQPRL